MHEEEIEGSVVHEEEIEGSVVHEEEIEGSVVHEEEIEGSVVHVCVHTRSLDVLQYVMDLTNVEK